MVGFGTARSGVVMCGVVWQARRGSVGQGSAGFGRSR